MKGRFLALILAITIFVGCGPKLSGKDEQSFKASKAKMEEKLGDREKEKLEIALRVVIMRAMGEKWNNPDDPKYKGKSFDAIAMAMVDGKTFSGTVNFAEDFLKEDRDKNIEHINKEMDSLTKGNSKIIEQNKKLNQLKLTKISIIQQEGFGKLSPNLLFTFVNNTGSEILAHMIGVRLSSKKTGKQLNSIEFGNGSELDSTMKDGDGIKPGEELTTTQGLGGIDEDTEFFKNAKYPITDFSKLDFVVEVYPAVIITRREKLVRTEGVQNLDRAIRELQLKLKTLEETKGSLDELELTN